MTEQNITPTPLTPQQQKEVLEAILFAAGYPVPYTKLAEALDMAPSKIKTFANFKKCLTIIFSYIGIP